MGLGRLSDTVFEAVLFDMDGTLIDSTPAVIRAWTTWMHEFGLTPEQMGRHHGMPSAQVVRHLLAEDRHVEAIQRIELCETPAQIWEILRATTRHCWPPTGWSCPSASTPAPSAEQLRTGVPDGTVGRADAGVRSSVAGAPCDAPDGVSRRSPRARTPRGR